MVMPEAVREVNAGAEAGIEVDAGSVISAVQTTMGGLSIQSVKIAAYRKGQGRVIKEKKADCDFIAMSGGWNPALHLWCHNGGKIRFDDKLQSFRPDRHGDAIHTVGAANGTFALSDILNEAYAAGETAAKAAVPGAVSAAIPVPAAPCRGASARLRPTPTPAATMALRPRSRMRRLMALGIDAAWKAA